MKRSVFKAISILIVAMAVGFSTLFLTAYSVLADPPTTPIIDGSIAADGVDWDTDELVVDDPVDDSAWGTTNELDNLYVTWDDDNLYVGVVYTISGNALITYVDLGISGGETDFNSGNGWTGAYPRNFTFSADNDIDLMLARWDTGVPAAYSVVDNSSSDITGNSTISYTANTVEYAIPWSQVGGRPYSDTLCVATVIAGGDDYGGPDSMPDNASTDGDGGPDAIDTLYCFDVTPHTDALVINEVDADSPSTDTAEFAELYDGGYGNTRLDELVLVLYNGSTDVSYQAFDLDSYTTNSDGYFVLCGDAANVSNCDLDVTPNTDLIQNGADAIALHVGDGTDFPNGTAVTNAGLIDALVYDTNDGDDAGLISTLLNTGQPQVNEDGSGDKDNHSNQRCPNGSGGQRNTDTFIQETPTAGEANRCMPNISLSKTANPDTGVPYYGEVTYTLKLANSGYSDDVSTLLTDTLDTKVTFARWLEKPNGAAVTSDELTWSGTVTTGKTITFTFVVTHTGNYEDVITNTAEFSGSVVISDTAVFDVVPLTPELVVSKVGPDYAFVDEDVVYTVTIKNNGGVAADGVVLTDTFPTGLTYAGDDSGVTPTSSGLVYTWTLGTIASGAEKTFLLTATVGSSVAADTVLTNTVDVSTSTAGDKADGNQDKAVSTVFELISIADALQLADGQVVAIEGYVNFPSGILHGTASRDEFVIQDAAAGTTGIDVFYNGDVFSAFGEGDKVRVIGELDEYNGKREIIPASPSGAYAMGETVTLIPVITDTGAISESTESVLVQISGEVTTAGSSSLIVNDGSGGVTVYRDSDTGISFAAIAVGDYVQITGVGSQYDSSAPYDSGYQVMPRFQRDIVEYPAVDSTIPADKASGVAVNSNISATFNVTVTNVSETTFLLENASGAVAGTVTYDSDSMTAVFDPSADLDMGTTYTATIKQSIENETGQTMVADYVWSFRALAATDIAVSKEGPSAVKGGESLVYTITVQNAGTTALADVILTDTLPVSTTYVADDSGVAPGEPETGVYVWSLGTLGSGIDQTILLTVTVDGDILNGTVLTNSVEVSTSSDGDSVDNNEDDAVTTASNAIAIYDVQHVGDPASSDTSPYANQDVMLRGIVYAVYSGGYFIADAPGPWNGVYVYSSSKPAVGDEVRVTGSVKEYYGLTEISDSTYEVLSSGNTPYAPSVVTAAEIPYGDAASEGYEGVFVEIHAVTVSGTEGYGIWSFTDASGGTAKADDWGYNVNPSVGDSLAVLRGALVYDYNEYKVMPRDENDVVADAIATISKDAPSTVGAGERLTYTLTLENKLGIELTNITITDVVPANTTFAEALDAGAESAGVVSWNIASLADGASVTVRFVVTATETQYAEISNEDYGMTASNSAIPVTGDPVLTLVTDQLLISQIQGAGHLSPFADREVEGVVGIVTAKDSRGFYIQDVVPDGDIATSDGIYVYGSASAVTVGDEVTVAGLVDEYRPGSTGLTITQLKNVTVVVNSSGNTLPAPVVIGTGGRVPPAAVIDDDSATTINVEQEGVYDAVNDGIDFYESLEGMLVKVNDAVAVGPTSYEQIPVVGDGGANASVMTPRGGIVIQKHDFNPERIILDDGIVSNEPTVNTGVAFSAPITGVIGYSDRGLYLFYNLEPLPATTGGVVSETTTAAANANQLRVASFNVYNLDPGDNAARVAGIAGQIVNNLLSPDIIGLEEIQDNNGETDDGVVSASDTYTMLIEAIQTAGGPVYDYRDIAPTDNEDGGAPGANIRVGFLFRPDRVSFVDRAGGDATTAVSVTLGTNGVQLTYSPGRIDPTNDAFYDSRKPLAGEFLFNGHNIIVVANHFNSKGGDEPLFGFNQPPVLISEVQRKLQAQVVNNFVDDILALDSDANVILVGDFNDFQFSEAISDVLAADVLVNLASSLPVGERYSYNYEGNAQALDHILASHNLFDNAFVGLDIVHVNSEFAYSSLRPSDHDPLVATFELEPKVYLPDLSVMKTVYPTADVALGGTVTYTLVVSNSGDGAATSVVLTDALPSGVTFGSWVEMGSAVLPGSDTIKWGPYTVPAGEEYAIRFTAIVTTATTYAGETITNTVEFASENAGSGMEDAAFVVAATAVDTTTLDISKAVVPDSGVNAGDVVTYTITLGNSGAVTAEDIMLTDTLPLSVTFGGFTTGNNVTANYAAGELTWSGDLASGVQPIAIVFTATVGSGIEGATVENIAEYTATNADPGSDNAIFSYYTPFKVYLPTLMRTPSTRAR